MAKARQIRSESTSASEMRRRNLTHVSVGQSLKQAKKNTGIQYELVAKTIFDDIVNTGSQYARTIDVRHNASIKGKLAPHHQIDVYWEFELGAVVYRTVVQVRDWNSTIKQSHLLEFKGVLDDIPGQPRGIYVTRKGFQKGALTFARANGIELFLLQPKVSTGIVMTMLGFARITAKRAKVSEDAPLGWTAETIIYEPAFASIHVQLGAKLSQGDAEPILNGAVAKTSRSTVPKLECCDVFDVAGELVGSLLDVFNDTLKSGRDTLKSARDQLGRQVAFCHRFEDEMFLAMPGATKRERLHAITGEVRFDEVNRHTFPLELSGVVSFILERIGMGERQVFRVDMRTDEKG